jgi:O-antigen ligase
MLAVLLVWMLFQMIPLPAAVVAALSPQRWNSVRIARSFLGFDASRWLPLSVAPAATLERLLYVVPAMAAFVATREMGRWWRGTRLWIVVAPVIGVALLESLLGLAQFDSAASTEATRISGTYVNPDHFAGLLEMALPLALTWALGIWRNASGYDRRPARAALPVLILLGVSACILAGVSGSFSRMGFMATLAGVVTVAAGWLVVRNREAHAHTSRWLWLLPVLLPLGIALFLATNDAMVPRFTDSAELKGDGRVQLWAETLPLIAAYKWTGTGIGAYQQGLYPFRTFAPTLTVDFAHNDYLQILAELGLAGGGLAIALAIWIFWRPLSIVAQPGSQQWALSLGLLGSLVAIGLHSFVDFNLYIPANAFALAWLAGVAVSPGLRER